MPDIYFTANLGANKLYLNKGNLEFEDISESAGIQGKNVWSTGVVMVDINNDGYVDLVTANINESNRIYFGDSEMTFSKNLELDTLKKSEDKTAIIIGKIAAINYETV